MDDCDKFGSPHVFCGGLRTSFCLRRKFQLSVAWQARGFKRAVECTKRNTRLIGQVTNFKEFRQTVDTVSSYDTEKAKGIALCCDRHLPNLPTRARIGERPSTPRDGGGGGGFAGRAVVLRGRRGRASGTAQLPRHPRTAAVQRPALLHAGEAAPMGSTPWTVNLPSVAFTHVSPLPHHPPH